MKRRAILFLCAVVIASLSIGAQALAQAGDTGKKDEAKPGGNPGDPKNPAPKETPKEAPKTDPKAPPKDVKPAPKPEEKAAPKETAKPAEEKKAEPAAEGEEGVFSPKLTGSLSLKYKIKYAEYTDDTGDKAEETDQDLQMLLNLSMKNLYKNQIHFHMMGGYNIDTWGRQDSKHRAEVFEFADVYDTYNHKAHGKLYYSYLETDDFLLEGLDMKFGRVGIEKGESIHIDGLAVSYEPEKALVVTAFAGLPVYFWKHHMVDNFTAGFYIEFLPFHLVEDVPGDTTKLTLEYIYVSEDQNDAGIEDNFFSVVLDQKLFHRTVDLQARASVLNGEFRDFKIRGTLRDPENDIRLRLMFFTLPVKLEEELSIDMSPFMDVMGRYNPYNEFKLDIFKGFVDGKFGIELGYHGRMLKKERYEGKFNHDFDRLYATGSAYDFLESHLDISVTVEYVQSMTPDDEDKILTMGFDLGYKFSDEVKFGIGMHYHRWEMAYLSTQDTVEELENVRLFSLFIDVKPVQGLKIGLNYSFETVGGDLKREYDRFMLSATYSF